MGLHQAADEVGGQSSCAVRVHCRHGLVRFGRACPPGNPGRGRPGILGTCPKPFGPVAAITSTSTQSRTARRTGAGLAWIWVRAVRGGEGRGAAGGGCRRRDRRGGSGGGGVGGGGWAPGGVDGAGGGAGRRGGGRGGPHGGGAVRGRG